MKAPAGVTLRGPISFAGSGRYAVIHDACGERVGFIAGGSWGWRYGFGGGSPRRGAPTAQTQAGAIHAVLYRHTCPKETTP